MIMVESVIVSVNFPDDGGEDSGILLVGKPKPGHTSEIINAFEGKAARELYKKLTKRKVVPEA